VCLEVIEDGRVLAVHADLGALPPGAGEELLRGLLLSNAPEHIEDGAVAGIDPVSGSVLLFRRFEDATGISLEGLLGQLQGFADLAQRKGPLLLAGPPAGDTDDWDDATPPWLEGALRA
jgi:hypothetical protein